MMGKNGVLRNETILFLAYSSWDVFRQDNELASLMARDNRVFYVEKQRRLGKRWLTNPADAIKMWRSCDVTEVNDHLVVCSPPPRLPWLARLRPRPLKRLAFHLSLRVNAAWLQRMIKRALAELDWHPTVLWCYEADALLLRQFFDVKWTGYRVYDEVNLFPFLEVIETELGQLERDVIDQADFVFASSQAQYNKRCDWHPNVYFIPNACAFERYSRYQGSVDSVEKPNDLPKHDTLIMFIGGIDCRLDFDLLWVAALQHPDWCFVFIGPVKASAANGPEKIYSLDNVVFLGEKPPGEVPRYLHFASVSLIPYLVNQLTRTMFPWKVYEHLAMGKAIVATDLPELYPLTDVIYLAKDRQSFLECLVSAMRQGDDPKLVQRRVERARANRWEDRLEEIANIIAEQGE